MAETKKPILLLSKLLTAVLVAANLVVANLLVKNVTGIRTDLTEDQRYEIGKGTRSILGDLEDSVSVRGYFSGNVPPRYAHVRRTILEKLQEYESASGNKLTYEFLDPETNEQAKRECDDQGIQPAQIEDFENVTTSKFVTSYMALVFRYQDRKSILNCFVDLREGIDRPTQLAGDLEYYLTNHIVKVANERKAIGILAEVHEVPANQFQPRGPKRKTQGLGSLKQWLERSYDVLQLDVKEIARGVPIPDAVDTLIVWRPRGYVDVGLYAIDQFIMRGGNTLFFVDSGEVSLRPTPKRTEIRPGQVMQDFDYPTYVAQPIIHGLTPLLEHYGLRVEANFIQDESGFVVPYVKDKRIQSTRVPPRIFAQPIQDKSEYRSWSTLPARDEDGNILDQRQLNSRSGVVAGVGSFVLPWASPLALLEDNLSRHRATATYVLRSGPRSWSRPVKDGKFSVNPADVLLEPVERHEPEIIAARIEGTFKSHFEDRDIPAPLGTNGSPLEIKEAVKLARRDVSEKPTTIFVMGDADFMSDAMLQTLVQLDMQETKNAQTARAKPRAALSLVSNVVDALTFTAQADALADVRGKKVRSREIVKVEAGDSKKRRIDWINFGIVPGIVVAFGLIRLIIRNLATHPGVPADARRRPGDAA